MRKLAKWSGQTDLATDFCTLDMLLGQWQQPYSVALNSVHFKQMNRASFVDNCAGEHHRPSIRLTRRNCQDSWPAAICARSGLQGCTYPVFPRHKPLLTHFASFGLAKRKKLLLLPLLRRWAVHVSAHLQLGAGEFVPC